MVEGINPKLETLITERMQAEADMAHARYGREQAQQAYEFYQNRVADLVAQIAGVVEGENVEM